MVADVPVTEYNVVSVMYIKASSSAGLTQRLASTDLVNEEDAPYAAACLPQQEKDVDHNSGPLVFDSEVGNDVCRKVSANEPLSTGSLSRCLCLTYRIMLPPRIW